MYAETGTELKTIKPIKIVDVPQISWDLGLPPVTQRVAAAHLN